MPAFAACLLPLRATLLWTLAAVGGLAFIEGSEHFVTIEPDGGDGPLEKLLNRCLLVFMVFGAAYSLWMVKRVYFGAVANDNVKQLSDLNAREFWMLGILAIAVIAMGVYPKPFTDVMNASVDQLLRHVAISKVQ